MTSYSIIISFLLFTFNTSTPILASKIDLEKFIHQNKLQFIKSDTSDIVNLFGKSYEQSQGWSSIRGLEREIIMHTEILYYYYEDMDVEFVFKQRVTDHISSKNKTDDTFVLYKIKVFSCFEGKIFKDIKIGQTLFKNVSKKIQRKDFHFKEKGSTIIAKKRYKNFIFHSEIKNIDNESNEELKERAENATINYIEIVHKNVKQLSYSIESMDTKHFSKCEQVLEYNQ